jgi:hypothetical protein
MGVSMRREGGPFGGEVFGWFFVTGSTKGRRPLLGAIVGEEFEPTPLGTTVLEAGEGGAFEGVPCGRLTPPTEQTPPVPFLVSSGVRPSRRA